MRADQPTYDYDLVIRNGRVLDGQGNPWVRADLDDGGKAARLAQWLDLDGLELLRMNEAGDKHYAEQYAATLRSMRLPKAYVDEMLGSRYARHFFSPDELRQLRERWVDDVAAPAHRSAPRDVTMRVHR